MNFKSQICTSREQSEKLLSLGLKKETADMGWQIISINGESVEIKTEDNWERQDVMKNHFPAWSLHRLIEIYSEHYISDCMNLKFLTYDTIIEEIRLDILSGTFTKEFLEEKYYEKKV